ncbi:hypothetical protein D3C85_1698810 [compost metagenome]
MPLETNGNVPPLISALKAGLSTKEGARRRPVMIARVSSSASGGSSPLNQFLAASTLSLIQVWIAPPISLILAIILPPMSSK